eukprot:SAG11_NODE_4_length_33019_cov_28.098909_33_plen_180_part_00
MNRLEHMPSKTTTLRPCRCASFADKINRNSLISLPPADQVPNTLDEVSWVVKDKKGKEKVKSYTCEDRAALMTEVQWAIFSSKEFEPQKYQVRKYTRNEKLRTAYLAVGGGQIMQIDASSGRVVSRYMLKDITSLTIIEVRELPGGCACIRCYICLCRWWLCVELIRSSFRMTVCQMAS